MFETEQRWLLTSLLSENQIHATRDLVTNLNLIFYLKKENRFLSTCSLVVSTVLQYIQQVFPLSACKYFQLPLLFISRNSIANRKKKNTVILRSLQANLLRFRRENIVRSLWNMMPRMPEGSITPNFLAKF